MSLLLGILIPLAILGFIGGAAFTAVDASLLSVSRVSLDRALEDGTDRVRRRVLRQHDDAARLFATVTLGRILSEAVFAVSIAAIAFGTMDGWALPWIIATVAVAALSFLGVSVSPRTLGRRHPEKVAIALSGLTAVARTLLWPLAMALIHVGSAFTPGGGVRGGPYATEAELRHFVDRATESQELEHDERDMIQGVFDLGDTRIREIMVPRTDMVTIAADVTAEKAARLFVRSGFSRIPVIGENVDDLLGVVYAKDIMRAIHSPWESGAERPVSEIMRAAMFVPEIAGADDVMRQMQTQRIHVAIVVDEYGGVCGIVTIEDVLEEIVGEIADEHDRREPEVEDLGEGVFRVPARESIADTGELFGLDIEDEDVDTVGGLLSKALGRVPIVGAEADTHGLHLEAETTAGRRRTLATVLVSRSETSEDEDDDQEDRDD
ncbi:hemolysin family protein [Brachybacterium sp. AOP25-B2-12]|uniref:hemolysin family protein n=1 Tax=Brachybacterium sp. AOP25-B2-12 TaxID=3457710 RepID=UPI004034556A